MSLSGDMRRDSRRYFERRLSDLEDDAATLCERIVSVARDLRDDGFYADTEDSQETLGKAGINAATLSRNLAEARAELPNLDEQGRPEPQSLKADR